MNEYKAVINIAGSCVSRDIFSYQENDGGYKISQYAGFFSILTACEEKIPVDEQRFFDFDTNGKINLTPFFRRCIYQDFTRTSLDYVKKIKSDFLILDAALLRRNYIQIGNKDNKSLVFGSKKKFYELLADENIIPPIVGEYDFSSFSKEEIKERLTKYVNSIRETYDLDSIVLIEVKHVYYYIGEDAKIHPFDKEIPPFTNKMYHEENKKVDICFQIMKDLLKGCYVIPMPQNVIADANAKLGIYPMHYTAEYYNYAFKCMEIIRSDLPKAQKQETINDLCSECNELYIKKYHSQLLESVNDFYFEKEKYKNTADRLRVYIDFFQKAISNNVSVKSFFMNNNINSVAIYGLTKYSESIAMALANSGIEIKYIVENIANTKRALRNIVNGGVLCYPRNLTDYPCVDAIVIGDLNNKNIIKQKLQKLTNIQAITDDDILNYTYDAN